MKLVTSLATLCAMSMPAAAADLDVIVDRRDAAVEVFVSLAATDIPAIFGNSADFIAPPGVVVEYEALREGTWDQGDAMFAGNSLRVAGDAVTLEAMSLMVHPKDAPMPFNDVADAYLAMSVCNGFAPGTVPTVDILHVYAGYIAYPVDAGAALSFALNNSDFLEVNVREFVDGVHVSRAVYDVVPGGEITLAAPEAPAQVWRYFAALSALAAVLLAACALVPLLRRARRDGGLPREA